METILMTDLLDFDKLAAIMRRAAKGERMIVLGAGQVPLAVLGPLPR